VTTAVAVVSRWSRCCSVPRRGSGSSPDCPVACPRGPIPQSAWNESRTRSCGLEPTPDCARGPRCSFGYNDEATIVVPRHEESQRRFITVERPLPFELPRALCSEADEQRLVVLLPQELVRHAVAATWRPTDTTRSEVERKLLDRVLLRIFWEDLGLPQPRNARTQGTQNPHPPRLRTAG